MPDLDGDDAPPFKNEVASFQVLIGGAAELNVHLLVEAEINQSQQNHRKWQIMLQTMLVSEGDLYFLKTKSNLILRYFGLRPLLSLFENKFKLKEKSRLWPFITDEIKSSESWFIPHLHRWYIQLISLCLWFSKRGPPGGTRWASENCREDKKTFLIFDLIFFRTIFPEPYDT